MPTLPSRLNFGKGVAPRVIISQAVTPYDHTSLLWLKAPEQLSGAIQHKGSFAGSVERKVHVFLSGITS